MVKLGNTTKAVNEAMCLNAGLRKPSTIKRCRSTEWKVAEWAPVSLTLQSFRAPKLGASTPSNYFRLD